MPPRWRIQSYLTPIRGDGPRFKSPFTGERDGAVGGLRRFFFIPADPNPFFCHGKGGCARILGKWLSATPMDPGR